MDFISFALAAKKQNDSDLSSFTAALKNIKGIPSTSDPRILGKFLYPKLNKKQTFGFQKWFFFYKSFKDNEIPENLAHEKTFLFAINLINMLQNSDPDYRK